MKNIERLSQYITKNGAGNIMVHTIQGTSNWVVAQKIERDKWMLTLCNPLGTVIYDLDTIADKDLPRLWVEITRMTIENKYSQATQAKEIKKGITPML